jgi:hypothetical protein
MCASQEVDRRSQPEAEQGRGMLVRRFVAGKSAGARSKLRAAPGANRERGGQLAHRSLIADVLEFRLQAADHCPPETRADPAMMSEPALFRSGAWPHRGPLTAQKADSANAGNGVPVLRRKTAFMFEGKKAFPAFKQLAAWVSAAGFLPRPL